MTTHEAVLGGARWRLTLADAGVWHIDRRVGLIWDQIFSGNDGLMGVREAISAARERPEWFALAGADVLLALADVAERSTTNG